MLCKCGNKKKYCDLPDTNAGANDRISLLKILYQKLLYMQYSKGVL